MPRTSPTNLQRINVNDYYWRIFAAAAVTVIIVAAIRWSFDHPYGIQWDEAIYFNDVQIDLQRLQDGRLSTLGGRILIKSYGRPPAFRILALPFLALFGFHPTVARSVSLVCFALSSWFIYLATRRITNRAAGAFAVLVFALSPEVVSASIFFSTDAPLYLATAAMLYYMFGYWDDNTELPSNWIGLGLAIGLGLLSKASFLAIVLPVLAFWIVICHLDLRRAPPWAWRFKVAALAGFVAGPWWLLNITPAMVIAQLGRGFVRNSLGPPSVATWLKWLNTVFQGLMGHGVSILIGLIVITWLIETILRKSIALDLFQRLALGACACAGLPIVLAQLSGTNHLLRHISPALIPFAIAVGIFADNVGWPRMRAAIAVSTVLLCGQLLLIVAPVLIPNSRPVGLRFVNGSLPWEVMIRFDQWNWRPVRDISYNCGVPRPRISYLGGGREFDIPHIEFPWAAQATSVHSAVLDFPDVSWLWRYEQGPIEWQKVMALSEQSDVVLTAPHYVGERENKEDLDNEHNAEFASRLSQDPRFGTPIRLEMGRFEPVTVLVFPKKTLQCPAQPDLPAHP